MTFGWFKENIYASFETSVSKSSSVNRDGRVRTNSAFTTFDDDAVLF